ncbi:MAG: phosphoglycerate dehydrogenase [Chitinophagaceae bacterium]|nr:phosphoglycerate dehydrogenase [Chitinophagaceae bacterium]MCA6464545.1 phosphoglycerate dehydrogenase [Chitinophagaceae bacterium]
MKVKVSTIAFSSNAYLVAQLKQVFPGAEVNDAGKRIKEEDLPEFFAGAEGIIVGLEPITPQLLDKLPDLRIIAKYGVGLDNINLSACAERGIQVGWTGGVNKTSVAEMALGFMLALSRNLYSTSNQLKQGVWNKSGGFQLTGKTVGIVGLGNIGKEVARLLTPFQCKILVNDIEDVSEYAKNNQFEIVSKETLFAESDIVTIHTPLTPETQNMVNLELISKMKKTAFIINTARGGIVNESDLKVALREKLISGAALDVYETEPPVDMELLSNFNLINTPHTGGNAYEAVVAMGMSAISHLVNYSNK